MSKDDNVGIGDGLRVTLPSEHALELYNDVEYLGTATGTWNPDPWPRAGVRGIGVPRLDHTLITTDDPDLLERFFADVLDFRAAERLVAGPDHDQLVGSWIFCGEQPHDIAFVNGEQGKLHHFAYHVDDWGTLLHAGDVFHAGCPHRLRPGPPSSPEVARQPSSTSPGSICRTTSSPPGHLMPSRILKCGASGNWGGAVIATPDDLDRAILIGGSCPVRNGVFGPDDQRDRHQRPTRIDEVQGGGSASGGDGRRVCGVHFLQPRARP